jgi:hypothetical protein
MTFGSWWNVNCGFLCANHQFTLRSRVACGCPVVENRPTVRLDFVDDVVGATAQNNAKLGGYSNNELIACSIVFRPKVRARSDDLIWCPRAPHRPYGRSGSYCSTSMFDTYLFCRFLLASFPFA